VSVTITINQTQNENLFYCNRRLLEICSQASYYNHREYYCNLWQNEEYHWKTLVLTNKKDYGNRLWTGSIPRNEKQCTIQYYKWRSEWMLPGINQCWVSEHPTKAWGSSWLEKDNAIFPWTSPPTHPNLQCTFRPSCHKITRWCWCCHCCCCCCCYCCCYCYPPHPTPPHPIHTLHHPYMLVNDMRT
jgi:hypothetical protein